MISQLNLNWLRTFEASARLLNFTAAAKELGMTQVAVSLQIKALESKLGQNLFMRQAKSLLLTEVGKAYLPAVRDGLNALSISTTGIFGSHLPSTVKIRGSMALLMWLAPQLEEFQNLHPEIRLMLLTSIWADPADRQLVDVDIVLAPDDKTAGLSEKLSTEYIVPVCGTERAKHISSPQDLPNNRPVHIRGFDDHWYRYLSNFNVVFETEEAHLSVDTSVTACEFVANNSGCTIMIERFAKAAIKSGKRIEIVGEPVPLLHSHYLAQDNNDTYASLVFKTWLKDKF